MSDPLDDARDRLRWATHQLSLLKLAVSDYVNEKPYVAVIEDHAETQQWLFRASLRCPPPASISHIVGDALNNLHGVLDYIAWQLVLREGKAPGVLTAFPIQMPNKDGTKPSVNIRDSRRKDAISDPAVLDILKSVQPYQNGAYADIHPLQLLRRFNRESKHRHLAVIATAGVPPRFMTEGNSAVLQLGFAWLEDGHVFGAFPYGSRPQGGTPEEPELTTHVGLEGVPRHPETGQPVPIDHVVGVIETCIERRVLEPLAKLF